MSRDLAAELLEQVAAGDHAAFRALYDATSAKLYGVILRMTRRPDWAAEALQEAYWRIWQRADDYRPMLGPAATWMVGLARERAIDLLRSRREGMAGARDPLNPAGGGWTEDMAPDEHQAYEATLDCLQRLEGEQQQALLLAYYYGLAPDELAERMGVPAATVRDWLRRGLTELRLVRSSPR